MAWHPEMNSPSLGQPFFMLFHLQVHSKAECCSILCDITNASKFTVPPDDDDATCGSS